MTIVIMMTTKKKWYATQEWIIVVIDRKEYGEKNLNVSKRSVSLINKLIQKL